MLSFGPDPGKAAWIVAGDLNDYLPSTGLPPLLGQPWLENIVERIADPNDRWTHHWDDGDEYTQLDNLLLSRALAKANPNAVQVMVRNGMPWRATRYTGPRFDGVGENRPKASDHCPLVIELEL
jgi:predicted extracellular nuclease